MSSTEAVAFEVVPEKPGDLGGSCEVPSDEGVLVTLRPTSPRDAPLLAAWRDESEVSRYQPLVRMSLEGITRDLENLSAPYLMLEGSGYTFRWIVEVEGQPAGWVSLYVSSWSRQTAELAYSLSNPYQRRGIMKRAIRLLLHRHLSRTTLQRLEVHCVEQNQASCKMIERCGFRLERTNSQDVNIRGVCFNSRLYVLDLPGKSNSSK